jgi:chemotaxis protein MotB
MAPRKIFALLTGAASIFGFAACKTTERAEIPVKVEHRVVDARAQRQLAVDAARRCERERRQLLSDLELTRNYDPSMSALAPELANARSRIDELSELLEDLKAMRESGEVSVSEREGVTVLQLSDRILFPSGRADLTRDGRRVVDELADILSGVRNHQLLVAGHTDDRQFKDGGFASNWELSVYRALSVLKELQKKGIEPERLAAAGYGEHVPVASNADEEGRAQNRRTEIVLMPLLSEIEPTLSERASAE